MQSWFSYLKQGFSRGKNKDQISLMASKPKLSRLFPFFFMHWPKAILGAVLIFTTSAATYIQPLVQRFLIDDVILKKQLNLFFWVISLYICLYLLSKLSNIFQQFYITHFTQSVMLDIQDDLLRRVLHFPKSFFDDKETGYLISRLNNDIKELQWFFSGTIVYMINNIFSFFVGLSLLIYLKWYLALAVLAALPFLAVSVYYFSGKTKNLSHHNMEQQANVLKHLHEALSSIPLLKAFVSEKHEAEKIKKELETTNKIYLEQTVVHSFAQLVISALKDLSALIVLAAGVPLVISGNWTMGSLYAFFAYLSYVYNPVSFFANSNFQLQRALAALERVSAFYDILPEEHGAGLAVKHLSGAIEFRNVSFSYNGRDPVLKNISFSIAKGEHVAIIGTSGVGKTTLISLLLCFYKPVKGEIFFDGCPIKSYAVDSLRRRIGYVSQSTRLLTGTIISNLHYGNQDISEEDLIKAARIAGIHDFIKTLPDGYHTILGENGVNLSEGQRQRLSLARALAKDPDILILDEPSSSLDEETEKSIFDSLPEAAKDKTMIVVTHRQSTIKALNRVVQLNAN